MSHRLALALTCLAVAGCDGTVPADGHSARPIPGSQAASQRPKRPVLDASAFHYGFDACDPNVFTCMDSQTLEYCSPSGLVAADCAAICGSAGYALSDGCGYDAGLGGDACFCDDAPAGPAAPSGLELGWSCVGDDLAYNDGSFVETWSCDGVCQDAGFDYASGCDWDFSSDDDACLCNDAPSTTDPGYSGCAPGDQVCGDGTCVSATYICDGYDDCASGADEYGCAECNFDGGQCNGSVALDVCDQNGQIATYDCDTFCRDSGFDYSEGCAYDAGGGSDACFCADAPTCAPGELTCGDGSCVPNQYVCDGYVDCAGGDDEFSCAPQCNPGDVICTSDFTIETCSAEGVPTEWDCDAVCQDAGYAAAESCSADPYSSGDACNCID